MSGTGLRAAFTSLAVLLFATGDAWAAPPKKEECISAFDAGQRARREGHLKQAHESLVVCSQKECPTVVRADCSDVLKQVDDAQPSIVLGASDTSGKDLTDVTVELDGHPLATELNGRAILVDPGKLSLVFKRPPWDPVTVDVVIKEAEKDRSVRATLGPPAPAPAAATKPVPVKPEETPSRGALGYAVPGALAALGLGALAYAGVTRLQAGNDADRLKSTCGPICPESDRDSLSSDLVRANASFAIGMGLVVLAATSWFILGPRRGSL
jgi:hypothetical protein